MNSKEELKNELIVGYDLCNDYSQISYYDFTNGEPKTISTTAGKENFLIPMILLKKKGAEKWYLGEEALKRAANNEEIYIKDILTKCSNNEISLIEGKEYTPAFLLEIFIRKSFGFFMYEGITQKIPDKIVFTVSNMNKNIVAAIKLCVSKIGISLENIYIQDHEESFFEYTIHQKNELWNYNVILLEYTKTCLKAYNLQINTKTTPITGTISKKEFNEITNQHSTLNTYNEVEKKNLDQLIKETLKNYFGTSLISCIFLCGEGFEGELPIETLRFLCAGRRVFQGKNLYTKGACYAAAKSEINKELENYLFLGENKLIYNIGLDVYYKGENQYYPLATANDNWYDASKKCELILDNESCVELKLTSIDNKDTRTIIINLYDLPMRPNGTLRILLELNFESASIGKATIKDLGFGEFYESSGRVWNHEMIL